MKSKTDQIHYAWASGNRIGALRIAARFFDRSAATKMFQRGMDAHNNPEFYRQLSKDPQELITAALDLLAKRCMGKPEWGNQFFLYPRRKATAWSAGHPKLRWLGAIIAGVVTFKPLQKTGT